nr:zinc ABC transporter substrate-binding protein [Mycoplana dimorpha]
MMLASAPMARAEVPNVVVSVKPIHSLVAFIMQGVGEPRLIVEGAASPHTYTLKPSNAAALQEADIVFWVGHGFETILERPLDALGSKAKIVALEDAPGLQKLKMREGGTFEPHQDDHTTEAGANGADDEHAHNHDGHAHEEGGFDTHLWLDPANAKAMAAAIEETLSAQDPANAVTYEANLAALNANINALDREIRQTIAPVKDKPFVVFHDAYQYFEHRYGMRVIGSITVSPETMPGAARISEIRQKVTELGAACVFAEPQFEPKLVNVVLEGTSARAGALDPEGATLPEGPKLYLDLMRSLATSLRQCLSSAS